MSCSSRGLVSCLAGFSCSVFASETVVVTATRAPEDVRTLPASITVITRQDVEQISGAGQGLGYVLARLAPGMGPETNSVSNFGQQLQGRKVLLLIDGIPQTENRQISRQINTIQASSIERIEIISGATALYGADAIGGVINIITRRYAEDSLQQKSRVQVSASEKASLKEGGAFQLEHTASGTVGASQYLLTGAFEKRYSSYDAQGDLIPPEPAQTSRDQVQALDGLFKYAYQFTDDKKLELAISAYQDKQDLDYTVGVNPYRAVHGLKLEEQPFSERQQFSLRYEQDGFSGNLYQRSRRYRFFPFVLTSPFTLINQSTSESQVVGARLQWNRAPLESWRLIYGLDYENEKGQQKARAYDYTEYYLSEGLVYQAENGFYDYGPDVQTEKLAPFLQASWAFREDSQLHAGIRHEWVRQQIADFSPPLETAIEMNYNLIRLGVSQLEQSGRLPAGTVASLPAVYQKALFKGGEKSFGTTALNLGYVFHPSSQQQLYLNYAQGYELADTARLMRDAVAESSILPLVAAALQLNVKTSTVDDLDVATIATQSVNAGYKRQTSSGQQNFNVFVNQSDKFYRFNRDFSVDLLTRIQQVYGFETAAEQRWPGWTVGGSYVMAWRVRSDHSWLRLSTVEVNPPKLTLHASKALSDQSLWRFQSTRMFSQKGSETADVHRFRGYSMEDVHWLHRLTVGSTLSFGVSNVFNHDYKSVFHQWAEATYGASSATPASGRRFSAGFETLF